MRASHLFPQIEVIEISAKDDIIEKRLLARKRECPQGILERLGHNRDEFQKPPSLEFYQIDNSNHIDESVESFRKILLDPTCS
jgi:ribose 1,5-bisphosphokinase PhnN